jgi:hypothetical protein
MQMKRTPILPAALAGLVAVLILGGCERDGVAAGQAAEAGAAGGSDQAAASVWDDASDAGAVRDFRLTIDRVRRMARATESFSAAAAGDPALQARYQSIADEAGAGVAELARAYEAFPEWNREIRRAGLSAEEFVLTLLSLSAVTVHVMTREAGHEPQLNEWTSARNIAVFDQHRAEIEGIMQRLQELGSSLEMDDEDPEDYW